MKAPIRIICLILCLSIITPMNKISLAADDSVEVLTELGLISNTTPNELYINLNRLVGITMILKAMGYTDADANRVDDSTVFNDLTGNYRWGTGWVNIGVENNITTGTSQYTFSPGNILSKKEYLAYLLRLLGYGIDESYKECDTLAINSGLINSKSELIDSYFSKKEAMDLLHQALSAKLKNQGNKTLIEQMIEDGIISQEMAKEYEIEGANELKIASVTPLSNTYIQIELSESIEFISPSDFKLIDYYEDEVDIDSAYLYNHGRTIILKTDDQEEEIEHTLTIKNMEYSYEALPDEDNKPRLIDVDVINSTSIRLVFNEPMSEKALDEDYYSINDLKVKSVEYELIEVDAEEEEDTDDINEWDEDWYNDQYEETEDEAEYELSLSNIILTTSTQTKNKSYRVEVDSVTDLSYNKINTAYDDEYFRGNKKDTDEPELERADAITATRVKLTFSEDLDETSAENEDNYEIDGLIIRRAILDADDESVVYLTTSEQRDGYKYKVEVKNVKDLDGDLIDTSNDSDTFYGEEKDDEGPRLVYVLAISNTKVRVEFNEPVDEATALMEHAYYFGDELGYALEVEQDEDHDDGTTWILTTMTQLDQEYILEVKGIKDLEGNLVDEDYAEESFLGIPTEE